MGLIVLLPLGVARAQQPPSVQIPASAYGPAWTGFYVGAAFGGGALIDRLRSTESGVSVNSDSVAGQGMLASIYGGVDYQVAPQGVLGLMVEGTYSGFEAPTSSQINNAGTFISSKANIGWAAMVRAGYLPSPKTMLFLTGGYVGQNIHTDSAAGSGGNFNAFGRDDTFHGWAIGGGVEALLGGNWSTKLEYRYSQFGEVGLPGTQVSLRPTSHTIRAGVSYKFGGLGQSSSAPEPAENEAIPDWSGIYFGAAGGGSATVDRLSTNFTNNSRSTMTGGSQDFLGAAYGGFDLHAAPRAIVGLMGEVGWTGPQTVSSVNSTGANATATIRPSMNVSALARAGYLVTPATLFYAAGGYTGEAVSTTAMAQTPSGSAYAQRDDFFNGWTLGPGIETMLFDGWSTKLEYRYTQFEEKNINGLVNVQPSMHTLRAGVSYKFGRSPPAPSAN